ncbi:MAG: glycosyltransferase [Saprospiraceae bacterium]|nr:glycosyltransferase [Saprospiraceae bacterium]
MITVIIPVFNAAAFVEEAVRSALSQTEVSEVIIIEDGSADESLRICGRLDLKMIL